MPTNPEELELLAYLKVNGATSPKVIPERNVFTFLAQKDELPQVWKYDIKTNQTHTYTDLSDRVLSVHHAPSGNKTIIGMDYEGNEKQQLYLIDQDGNVEDLAISTDHFHRFGDWSPDEQQIVFSSNRRHPAYFDLYLVDVRTKEEKLVLEVDDTCTPICWTKNGESLVVSMPETNIDNALYLFDLDHRELHKLSSEDSPARYQSIELLNDGKSAFVLTDKGRDTLGIYKLNLQTGDLKKVHGDEQWDIEEIKLSDNQQQLLFTINKGGVSSLKVYDLSTGTVKDMTELPTGVYNSLSWLTDSEIILSVQSAILPGDVWKVDMTTGEAERLTTVGQEEAIEHQWLEPELHSFSSFDGLEVPYFLYGQKKTSQPVVVYVHGGPEHQIRSEYNPVIQYLAANGFMVIAPNVRGSMGYGRKYVQLDDVRKRMDSVADLKWLVKDLVTNHQVDPEKVGIMGRSYGGFMVLASLTHYPDIWAAGVNIVGISHFKTFLENTGPWRRKLREFEYGSLENDADFFEEIAPLNHTDKITAPLLVFHGRNDVRVPVTEAEQLTKDLEDKGRDVELVVFENEGHQTVRLENHILMNSKIVDFMKKHL